MKTCHICQQPAVSELLDLGNQPVSNRFLTSSTVAEDTYPIVVGQCSACGTVQISDPLPAEALKPRFDWIVYREPEDHLDSLADTLSQLPGITPEASIGGISYKDDPLLERLRQRGFTQTWRLNPATDLGIDDPRAGIEIIQHRLTPESARAIATRYGKTDLLIVRHILEHAHQLRNFAAALRELLTPQGYIVFEIPDCERSLDHCDYTTIWEEHVIYFTPETFRNCFAFNGFSLVHFESFPYPFENSLVGIGQAQPDLKTASPSTEALQHELQRGESFSQGLAKRRDKLHKFLSDYRENNGSLALLGAGHLCCAFVCFLELTEYFEFVVDDNSHKQGLFMPGCRLPIYPSSALADKNIRLCLLSLSPDREAKVVQKNPAFLAKGGEFASIFPASERAIKM